MDPLTPQAGQAQEERLAPVRQLTVGEIYTWKPDPEAMQELQWSLEYLAAGSKGVLLGLRSSYERNGWVFWVLALAYAARLATMGW